MLMPAFWHMQMVIAADLMMPLSSEACLINSPAAYSMLDITDLSADSRSEAIFILAIELCTPITESANCLACR